MDRFGILIGIAAGGFYLYTEIQKKSEEAEKKKGGLIDLTGESDEDDTRGSAFQHMDRVLAYRLLKEAHEEVADFDALTDAELQNRYQPML